jgi:enoyl-CoA hydratase
MSQGFVIEQRKGTLIVRFDRPAIRNPLSIGVLDGLAALFNDQDSLAEVDAVIFTGTGDAFASGADLREIADITVETATEFAFRGQAVMNRIASATPLTIAVINGYCFGGGLDLALACDRRIASSAAVFSHPGTGLGIITGWGGTQRLPRLIGEANAFEMFFTAGRFDTKTALRIGLVDEVAEDPYTAALAAIAGS